jgi:hypothetical protein
MENPMENPISSSIFVRTVNIINITSAMTTSDFLELSTSYNASKFHGI